jgi:hypothetical protein
MRIVMLAQRRFRHSLCFPHALPVATPHTVVVCLELLLLLVEEEEEFQTNNNGVSQATARAWHTCSSLADKRSRSAVWALVWVRWQRNDATYCHGVKSDSNARAVGGR